jgi:hypothetical protein
MTRPRLQLHLSTLLIVTLLAAGLVWLNLRERGIYKSVIYLSKQGPEVADQYSRFVHSRGWPTAFEWWWSAPQEGERYQVEWMSVLLNVLACVSALAVAAVAIEWGTRRMKRKPTP